MKYMLLMQFSAAGTDFPPIDTWTPEEVQAHIDVHGRGQREAHRRRRVGPRAGPGRARSRPGSSGPARTARRWSPTGRSRRPRSSWPASGSSTATRPQRAVEIAAFISTAPGPGGRPLNMPIEVRPVMSGAATGAVTADRPTGRRGPAARAGAAGPRRARPPVRRLRHRRGRGAGGAAGAPPPSGRSKGCRSNPARLAHQVAYRRMTEQLRSEPARRRREDRRGPALRRRPAVPRRPPTSAPTGDRDDTLMLLFLCCHPALTPAVGRSR